MYLVELRPGKEELYRSGDELAAAIRRGDVDVHSRIYHRATSKWISVTLHPQFKAIVAMKAAEPLPPLERNQWTYLTDQSETLQAGHGPHGEEGGSGVLPAASRQHPWRRLFGLGVAGVALVLGVQLAFSGPRPPWAGESQAEAEPEAAEILEAAQQNDLAEQSIVSLAGTSSAFSSKTLPGDAAAEEPVPVRPAAVELPRAPKLRLKTLHEVLPSAKSAAPAESKAGSIEGLLARYGTAYEAARERLESGMRVARVNQLFSPARLTPDGGVTDTRLALAGVANFMRVYRQQETEIEREYQDSFAAMSKEHQWSSRAVRRWYSRGPQKEPAALAALSARILSSVDTLLGVLDEEAGAYRLGQGTISFEDDGASRRYGELRKQITQMIESARSAGGEETGGPTAQLLQVVGTTRLPREI